MVEDGGEGGGAVTGDLLARLRREAEADREDARIVRLDAIRAAHGLLARARAEATDGFVAGDLQARLEAMATRLGILESLLRSSLGDGPGDEPREAADR